MAYKRSRREFEADFQRQESPFVYYGTPLPPLDDHSRDDGSYVPIWKQEVTDDRGRKRLHGAFTGGFSAGYFNTVGSKEGWTPSSFVSSRKNRAPPADNAKQLKPEDFMDEEDLREEEESKTLSTTGGFAGFGTQADPMRQDALADLFRPSEDSMGIKLLNRMGWREGQGIGPRVRRLAEPSDPDSGYHLFASSDAPMISLVRKSDFKGLDYEGETQSEYKKREAQSGSATREGQSSDDLQPSLSFANRSKKAGQTKGSGMGVGILNDTGSDDEDPYEMGPRISYNKTLGGDKKSKKKSTTSIGSANPLVKTRAVYIPKKSSIGISDMLKKCHDGRLPISGFVLGDELDGFKSMTLSDDRYKPEQVPSDWKPSETSDGDIQVEDMSNYTSTADAAKASTLTAKSRATILGEAALPGKSVFDYLSPAARDRLVTASGRTNLPPALDEAQSSGATTTITSKSLSDLIPNLDALTAQAALDRGRTGFMPYSDDLPKRERYQRFLQIRATTPSSVEMPPRALGHSDEDWANEMHEFARAAQVFKPVTGLMASRFTTAAHSGSSSQTNSANSNDKELLTHPSSKPTDPAEEAARLGMFGPATRTINNFYPSRLLCKRFGVNLPDHAVIPQSASFTKFAASTVSDPTDSVVTDQTSDRSHSAGYQEDLKSEAFRNVEAGETPTSQPVELSGKNSSVTSIPIIDPERNEVLEQERPGAAVFRAIFGSDDDEDDDDG